jgi:hypothetical protein
VRKNLIGSRVSGKDQRSVHSAFPGFPYRFNLFLIGGGHQCTSDYKIALLFYDPRIILFPFFILRLFSITLHVQLRDYPSMTRGQVGLLRLTCATLGFAISRRFIPAPFQPWIQLARLINNRNDQKSKCPCLVSHTRKCRPKKKSPAKAGPFSSVMQVEGYWPTTNMWPAFCE